MSINTLWNYLDDWEPRNPDLYSERETPEQWSERETPEQWSERETPEQEMIEATIADVQWALSNLKGEIPGYDRYWRLDNIESLDA